jgi:hypothetical protein
MGFDLKQHAKGRNVEPISSVLHVQTLDADCSALTLAPLDGEWVDFMGQGRAISPATSNGATHSNDSPMKMRMVWAHKDQSDIQATGRKRVPIIFKGDLQCRLRLFEAGDGDNSNPVPAAGHFLVVKATAATGGDINRRVCHVLPGSAVSKGDCVAGYVLSVISVDELEVVLYSQTQCPAGALQT